MSERKGQTHKPVRSVPLGTWGGEHIGMKITEGGGEVEYDCAHGTLDRRIVLDRRGRFAVPGRHVEERGGPIREGGKPDGYPVRFTGQIRGGTMRLTVRRPRTGELIGTFTLTHGREPSLVKCR